MSSVDDLVARANSAFVDDQYDEALALYTEALKTGPATGQLYSKRAATCLKLGRPAPALDDALRGLELSSEDAMLHFRKGLALIEMKRFSEAEPAFVRAKALGASDVDRWVEKCHLETEGMTPCAAEAIPISNPTPVNDRSETPNVTPSVTTLASKVRESFYDNRSYLSYTIYAKNLKPEDVHVEFIDEQNASIKLVLPDLSTWQKQIRLFSQIVPSESRYELNPFKVSLTLQKKHPGEKWDRLDEAQPVDVDKIIEQYPTSSKKKQNWNSIEKQVAEEEEKEQPDGDQALNKLFQQIYANASDETKRAMIKSYQTSGGTVLSTNWSEVKDKNYEDNVEAPSGMEVHRWNS